MKNITAFAVLVIMIQCAQLAFSQEEHPSSYVFSTGTKFGMFFGQTEEIVYPPLSHKAELLSQLLWDVKPVFYYGLTLDFSRAQPMIQLGFFANISLKNGVSGGSGNMEDRDWMSVESTALTHFSTHDNVTNEVFLFDFSTGVSFPIKHIFLLKTYLTVSYMRYNFSAQYGYATYARYLEDGMYASIYDNPNYISFAEWEKVINYTQRWFITAPGVSLGYYFNNNRSFAELSFQISPLIICNDLDEHLISMRQYRDYMRGGIFLEPGFHFSWFAGKRLELSLDFSWRYISRTWGETYVSPLFTQNYVQQGEAGAGMSMIDAGFCFKIHL